MNFPISTVHQLLARQKGDDYSFPYMSSSSRSLGFSAASIRAFTSLSSTRDLRHDGCINTCVFSGDGRVIVSGSDDRKLKLWNATSFQLLDEIQTRHRHNIFHVDFSHHAPDCLLSAAADGSLRITNILTKAETLLHSSENILHMFQIDVDNPFLVYTAEEEGHITRIDLRSRVTDMIFQNQISRQLRPVKALAQSSYSGGSQLLVGGYGLEVGVLDLRMTLPPSSTLSSADHNRFTQIFSPLESSTSTDPALGQAPGQFSSISVSGLDYNRNGRSFVVSYQSDQIYLFNTAITGTLKTGASAALGGHINHETFLKRVKFFGPRDEYVIAGSDHGYVWVWDANSGRLLPESSCYSQARYKYPVADREACRVVNVLKADKNACNGAIPHPFLPQFATYGIEDRLQVWGYRTPENAPPFKEGKNDTYVPYWRNYSSTSVMRGLPDYFEKRIAQLAPQHNCNMSKKSSEPIYTADSVLDLFSYHRNVAGIRAELLSCTDVDLECDPVDIGIIASAPEKGRIMMNCNTPNEAILRSTLLVVLEAFLVYLPSKTVDNGTGVSSFGTIKAWVDKHGSRSAELCLSEFISSLQGGTLNSLKCNGNAILYFACLLWDGGEEEENSFERNDACLKRKRTELADYLEQFQEIYLSLPLQARALINKDRSLIFSSLKNGRAIYLLVRMYAIAYLYKENGNAAFTAKDFYTAVRRYQRAARYLERLLKLENRLFRVAKTYELFFVRNMKASDTQGAQGAPHGDLHAESDSKSADDMELSCERVAEEKNADIECSDDDEEDFRNDLVDGIDIDPDEFDYFIFDDLSSSQLPTQASCYRVFSIMVIEFLFESGAVLKLYLITLSNLANAYYSLERHSAAQAICACALALEEPGKTLMAKIGGSIDGILAKLCYRQGLVKMQLRNFDEAVEYFKKAASLDPGNVAINSALALAKKKCAMASKSAALQYSKMFA